MSSPISSQNPEDSRPSLRSLALGKTNRQMDQERQMNQMSMDTHENMKGFILPKRGSTSEMSDQKAAVSSFQRGEDKRHRDEQVVGTCAGKTAVALLHETCLFKQYSNVSN